MFTKPKLQADQNGKYFKFYDGSRSKSIYGIGKFDDESGVYPILNNEGKVVEYMDLLGNFVQEPTKLALRFSDYYYENMTRPLVYGYGGYRVFDSPLKDLPSKYMVSKKVQKAVRAVEKRAIVDFKNQNGFKNLFELMSYRKYQYSLMMKKFNKARKHSKDLEIVEEINAQMS